MSEVRTIVLAGRQVAWRLRPSRRAKRIQITVTLAEGVEVVVPQRLKRVRPEAFLREHAGWVLERLEDVDRLKARAAPLRLEDHGEFSLFGRPCPIRWQPSARTRASYADGVVVVEAPTAPGAELFRGAIESLLRKIAREIFESRVDYWKRVLGVSPGRVRVAGQKTRWGSCSSSGTLSFNWRLALGPLEVLDYVVAHELTHLIHFDHGPGFQATLDRVLPEWRDREAWLAENGELLRI